MSKLENLNQTYSLKKLMEKLLIKFKIHDNEVLISVVGEFNKNLNELEKLTRTKVFLGVILLQLREIKIQLLAHQRLLSF